MTKLESSCAEKTDRLVYHFLSDLNVHILYIYHSSMNYFYYIFAPPVVVMSGVVSFAKI